MDNLYEILGSLGIKWTYSYATMEHITTGFCYSCMVSELPYGGAVGFDHYKIVKGPPLDSTILKLMHDPAIRKEILTKGDYVDTGAIPDLWVVNPDAENELFMAMSLSCGHCREEFGKIYRAYSYFFSLRLTLSRISVAMVKNASPLELSAVCIAKSLLMPKREHAIGMSRSEPPATPDAPQTPNVASILSNMALPRKECSGTFLQQQQ